MVDISIPFCESENIRDDELGHEFLYKKRKRKKKKKENLPIIIREIGANAIHRNLIGLHD